MWPVAVRHSSWRTLVLTDDECLWRKEALHSHASQFDRGTHAPVLDESLLDPLRLPIERYVVTS